MIYIDPPYNTGNDFVYHDDFAQTADEYDENWDLIWIRWNIDFKTQLLIKNLEESSLTKDIRAESIEPFDWWQSESIWTVTDKDIEQLRQKLTEQVYDKKMQIVSQTSQ